MGGGRVLGCPALFLQIKEWLRLAFWMQRGFFCASLIFPWLSAVSSSSCLC